MLQNSFLGLLMSSSVRCSMDWIVSLRSIPSSLLPTKRGKLLPWNYVGLVICGIRGVDQGGAGMSKVTLKLGRCAVYHVLPCQTLEGSRWKDHAFLGLIISLCPRPTVDIPGKVAGYKSPIAQLQWSQAATGGEEHLESENCLTFAIRDYFWKIISMCIMWSFKYLYSVPHITLSRKFLSFPGFVILKNRSIILLNYLTLLFCF